MSDPALMHACTLKEFAATAHWAYKDTGPLAHTQYDPLELTTYLGDQHNCYLTTSSFPHTNELLSATIVILFLIGFTIAALVGGLAVDNARVLSRP